MPTVETLEGDSRTRLRIYPEDHFDSIVTDPPYELGFMGKGWDSTGIAYDPELWAECLRVLKPGGYLLAFGGTRTYHRMAVAIEDSGFEIRDQMQWIYGSGFPKSLDVAKAIDQTRAEDKEPVRAVCRFLRSAMDARGLKSVDLASHFKCHSRLIDHWAARDSDSQPSLPTVEQWLELKAVLGLADTLDAEVWRLNGRKGQPGDTWQDAEILGELEGDSGGFGGSRFSVVDRTVRAPSETAAKWKGWGTALKPANEPICVARKPIEGTVAANVLDWGTGALNIDACRIPVNDEQYKRNCSADRGHEDNRTRKSEFNMTGGTANDLGRWPSNVILDEEAAAMLDEQTGTLVSGANPSRRFADKFGSAYGEFAGDGDCKPARGIDAGGASRFFYCAKASAAERGELNDHPTVKPVALMRYLVRLVTPPGGTVLDPFAGSGTTGEACLLECLSAVLVDKEPEHIEIIRRRLATVTPAFDFGAEDASV
jgi:hypothetical protein